MIKLLKFEIQRKWKMSVGVLAAYFLIYFIFLFKFNAEIREVIKNMNLQNFDLNILINTFGFKILFFILLGSALFFSSVVGAINNLRIEAKQSSRDLYFSIPMTAYSKIGSKVITSMVEIYVATFIAFYSVIKAFEFLTKMPIWKTMMEGLFSLQIDEFMYLFIANILQSLMMILVIYLSFAIFRSFFSQVKFGGLITIVIYVALNYILIRAFGGFIGLVDDATLTGVSLWLLLAAYAIFNAALFGLIGFLFEKRVSFD